MNEQTIIEQAELIIKQLAENPRSLRRCLDKTTTEQVIAKLTALSEQSGRVDSEADLLALADGIQRLIEDVPTLKTLFPNLKSDRGQRELTIAEFNKITADKPKPTAKDKAGQLKNHITTSREALRKALLRVKKS
ncbi:hypothetical protein QUF64_01785 [Anaerolineales bacterium HSG6]|nr:hypothetical protein [Anaerolineales bacterium HSG6]MDM8531013.1 hypothetical protein [Anaerolineales bacterium HSG25]